MFTLFAERRKNNGFSSIKQYICDIFWGTLQEVKTLKWLV
jgi:hypothetical protein